MNIYAKASLYTIEDCMFAMYNNKSDCKESEKKHFTRNKILRIFLVFGINYTHILKSDFEIGLLSVILDFKA